MVSCIGNKNGQTQKRFGKNRRAVKSYSLPCTVVTQHHTIYQGF